jgi:hypothetical protein
VAAVTPSDVWAVGYRDGAAGASPLVIHNDGSACSEASTGDLASRPGLLSAVRAQGPSNVWAVGHENRDGSWVAVAARWDGAAWNRTVIADAPANSELDDVTIIAPDDVWAVGTYSYYGGPYTAQLIEHWDGQQWSRFPLEVRLGGLNGVASLSGTDAWAVGYHNDSLDTLHWDGTTWTAVPVPNPGSSSTDHLSSVAAASTDDIWAVGSYSADAPRDPHTLIEHWDGSSWTVVPSPTISGMYVDLNAVAIGAGGERWAVGDNEVDAFAIRRCDGSPAATSIVAYPVVASTTPGSPSLRLTVSARLQANDDGVTDTSLDFDLGGGARCTAFTDSNGTATCSVDALPAAVANGGYTVTFAGDQFHLPSNGHAGLVG